MAQRIDKIILNFDQLTELCPVSKDQRDLMIDKRMESLESMKKIVLREAYFIEEEKRLINEKRL